MSKANTEHVYTAPSEVCKICQRVAWGNVIRLGFAKWRHDSCGLGSETWKDYYLALSKTEQAELTEFYNHVYEVRS